MKGRKNQFWFSEFGLQLRKSKPQTRAFRFKLLRAESIKLKVVNDWFLRYAFSFANSALDEEEYKIQFPFFPI
jgi:hypothetical protein